MTHLDGSPERGSINSEQIIDRFLKEAIDRYLYDGRHCSEMCFIIPAKAFDSDFNLDLIRIANPFGGGIAEKNDICGAIVGGCMTIGYFFGRKNDEHDQERCWQLTRNYYEWFSNTMGFVYCRDKTGGIHNWELHQKCTPVVEQSVRYLLNMVSEERLLWLR